VPDGITWLVKKHSTANRPSWGKAFMRVLPLVPFPRSESIVAEVRLSDRDKRSNLTAGKGD
jgi:hypothetical protein